MNQDAASDDSIGISIVVPTRDRPRALERCIAAPCALDDPHSRFEVVVDDDGSAETPDDVVEHSRSGSVPVRSIARAHAGPAAARNAGAVAAEHPFLAFIDDACTAEPWPPGPRGRAIRADLARRATAHRAGAPGDRRRALSAITPARADRALRLQ